MLSFKKKTHKSPKESDKLKPIPAEALHPLRQQTIWSRLQAFFWRHKYIGLNVCLTAILLTLIISSQAANLFQSATETNSADSTFRPLDALNSSEIAYTVASLGHYHETAWIETQIYNSQRLSATAIGNLPVVAKPNIIDSTIRTRKDIVRYVASANDTVAGLASYYNLKPTSIRWSNNLAGNNLKSGQQILIPPDGLNGIAYEIKADDSLKSLQEKYIFSDKVFFNFNDINDLSDLEPGEVVLLPNALPQAVKSVPHFLDQNAQIDGFESLSAFIGASTDDCRGCIPVKAGDVIGRMGNTGWSTGSHLHLEIWAIDGRRQNPRSFLHQNQLLWPVDQKQKRVTQNYHSGHLGLDIGEREGADIFAIDDGRIIYRGCMFLNTNYATFGVLIDHDSYYSLSIHLQAPNHKRYKPCSINRRSQYGSSSIDYSTNQ